MACLAAGAILAGVLTQGSGQSQHDTGPPPPSGLSLECSLDRVVDGDTIRCRGTGRVRLIGIDSPERSQTPFGMAATHALTELLESAGRVFLELDVERRDRYDRLLAYVWADSVMANWVMIRQGWAVVLTYPPNVRYVERFTAAQAAAREERAGLWEIDGFACLPRDRRRGRC